MSLTLDQARAIIDGAFAEARRTGLQPLAVTVLDAGGHPVAALREDGATFFRLDIARAKATGALGMGMSTRELAKRAADHPLFFTSLAVAVEGRVALSPGGVLIRNGAGAVIGAVGISGDLGDADEACALAGLAAAGLA